MTGERGSGYYTDEDLTWTHDLKSNTSAKARTMANTVFLVREGEYSIKKLKMVEDTLWGIADRMDSGISEMMTEIRRLRQKCGEV